LQPDLDEGRLTVNTQSGGIGSLTTLSYKKQEKVAVVTLNRPEAHNAFNHAMMTELDCVWNHIKSDDSVVVVVVTAAGDKAFCTGMDLSGVSPELIESVFCTGMQESPIFRMTALQQQCWKPVITAVNGMVCGGGFHFIADSDIVIAADHATFFDTHVKLGLIAGLEPVGLARRIPLDSVFRLAFLGGSERMSAEDALRCGLIGEVVGQQDLMTRAMELAEQIARHSPAALAKSKRAIWRSKETGLTEALGHTWREIIEHRSHPDTKEGLVAMEERRSPRWATYND